MQSSEIPCAVNSRFGPNKGCLVGTHLTFLDFITHWVNGLDADSGRGLVLFGQVGMGKLSIAHEITRLFHKMNHFISSFIFSLAQGEQSKQKAYLLFTTLAHHLADHYPPFKITLEQVLKNHVQNSGQYGKNIDALDKVNERAVCTLY
jgi:hypothetical protein